MDRLYALARRQGGVFTRRQARELGFSHETIARRLAAGEWRVVSGNVLTAMTSVLGAASLEWAAVLACGPRSVLSGPSAIRRHGIDAGLTDDKCRWVTIPPERHVRLAGVRTIREAVDRRDIDMVDGLAITGLGRSIVDTLRVVPERIGEPLLDWALLRRWITVEELERRALILSGRRGIGRLRKHCARVRDGARSAAERRLHLILADIPGWIANLEIRAPDGTLVARPDVGFKELRIAIEVDGLAFHTSPARFQRDRARQNALTKLNWRILRFTWDDLMNHPDRVRQDILDEIAKHDPPLRSDSRRSAGI